MVAKSPRIGVGPGFDSQGSVPLFHKYCFLNLYWIHWSITKWSDSANTPTSLSKIKINKEKYKEKNKEKDKETDKEKKEERTKENTKIKTKKRQRK